MRPCTAIINNRVHWSFCLPASLPALASAVLQSQRARRVKSAAVLFEQAPLAPAYCVDDDLSLAEQARRAAQTVAELVDKLDRLRAAYSYWPAFDASPFFDLYPGHAASLFRVEETRYTLRIRLYCDLLIPAFRAAERYWVEGFLPLYRLSNNGHRGIRQPAQPAPLLDDAIHRLAALMDDAEQVIEATVEQLSDNVDALTSLGGLEERVQHRPRPGAVRASGLPPSLQRLPREMPTLTLDALYNRSEQSLPGSDLWREAQLHPTSKGD